MALSNDPAKRAKSLANLRRGPSDDPAVRERQLQNLRPAPPAPVGNQRRLVHGGRSELLLRDVKAEIAVIAAALGDVAPINDPADVIAFEIAARALKRYRAITTWTDLHGYIDEKTGQAKPAVDLEVRAERQLNEALDRLGMNSMARMKIGLNVARARQFDLAQEWAQADDAIDGNASDGDDA